MNDASERASRQVRLPEVSAAGQEKIARATVLVRGRDGADIERLYLERAGVGLVLGDEALAPVPFPHAGEFRFAATRRIGAGAYRALTSLRSVLGLETR